MRFGVDIFHYSATEQSDDDFLLTSGFFSALQSFSEEVRESEIDFFSSSSEIFMFDQFEDYQDTSLVIIFDNDIQQSVAREILKQVKLLIQDAEVLEIPEGTTLSTSEERELRDKIEKVAGSLLSVEFQIAAAKELIHQETNISQLLIYDYYNDELHFNYSDDLEYDEDEELLSLRTLQRHIIPLIKIIDIGYNFDMLIVESYNYLLTIFKHRTVFTLVLAQDDFTRSHILDIPFRIMSLPGFSSFETKFQVMNSQVSLQLDDHNKLQLGNGHSILYLSDEKLLKTLAAVNRLVKSLNLDDYHEFVIYPEPVAKGYFRLTRNYTRGVRYIEIFS